MPSLNPQVTPGALGETAVARLGAPRSQNKIELTMERALADAQRQGHLAVRGRA